MVIPVKVLALEISETLETFDISQSYMKNFRYLMQLRIAKAVNLKQNSSKVSSLLIYNFV